MRKRFAAMMICSMLLLPSPVYATDNTVNVSVLNFDKIEHELNEHNPSISFINDGVADGSSKLNKNIKDMEIKKDELITSMSALGVVPDENGNPIKPEFSDPSNPTTLELLKYVNYISYLNYAGQIFSLQAQIDSLKDQRGYFWKNTLQAEMQKKQIVMGAQQLYLSYNTLSRQKEDLLLNRSVLESKLKIWNIKSMLGLVTNYEIKQIELDLKNINQGLKSLDEGLDSLKGELNLMFGQAYDTALEIENTPESDQAELDAMDFEDDLEDALVQSYDVRLQDDDDAKRDDAKRKFTKAFHSAYQTVKNKGEALDLERAKLDNEQETYDRLSLMYDLGMISKFNFDSALVPYRNQAHKLENAEQDLLKAYTDYDWMKKGLTVSAISSGQAQ